MLIVHANRMKKFNKRNSKEDEVEKEKQTKDKTKTGKRMTSANPTKEPSLSKETRYSLRNTIRMTNRFRLN